MDGIFLAISSLRTVRSLQRQRKFDLIDAHFGYPDGYAATLLGKWLSVPVTITLRGTEVPHAKTIIRRRLLRLALKRASMIFSVSGSLKRHAESLGIDGNKVLVVGNGVDTGKFYPEEREAARSQLKIPENSKVLITVGGLVERKGFHRIIEILPELKSEYPDIQYLIVGGASAEGDWSERLRVLVESLGLQEFVHFLGTYPSNELRNILSAADVFVLSTRNEGWANVLLEAMACGLPVVVTDVGGNAEVVCRDEVGSVVPFNDQLKLTDAIKDALGKNWDKEKIIKYAKENSWDKRVEVLVKSFRKISEKNMQVV
jgi:glycosyltransferase involved in cell wall biosynthesis